MEEAKNESKPRGLSCMVLNIEQKDKHHYVGKCGDLRFAAQIFRTSSPENMGGGRIRRMNIFKIDAANNSFATEEVLNYGEGWNTFPVDGEVLLAYTFIRHTLENIPLERLADE